MVRGKLGTALELFEFTYNYSQKYLKWLSWKSFLSIQLDLRSVLKFVII